MGWFTQKDGGTQVTEDTVFTGTANQTLYAHWAQRETISHDWFTYTAPTSMDYDEASHAFDFSLQSPYESLKDTMVVSYKKQGSNSEWTQALPVNAGTYDVKITRDGDDYYLPMEELFISGAMVINRIHMYYNAGSQYPTYLPWPKVSCSNHNLTVALPSAYKGDGAATYILRTVNDDNTQTEYARNTTGTFSNVPDGMYVTYIEVAQGSNYLATRTLSDSFHIVNGNYSKYGLKATTAAVQPEAAIPVQAVHLSADSGDTAPLMTLSPEQVCLNRGKEFQITLDLSQATDVWGILANVDYDSETLELTSYTLGDTFTQEQYRVQEDLTAAPFRLLATLDEIGTTSAQGAFVTLNFKVKETAQEKDTAISLSRLEVVGESAPVAVEAGHDVPMAVDETAPVLEGIADGQTYQGDTLVTVVEPHLQSVAVNGKEVTVTDHTFTLSPTLGKLTVVATDYAGNQTTVTVTVEPIPEEEGPAATGDSSHLLLWTAGMLLGLGGLAALAFVSTKRHKKS